VTVTNLTLRQIRLYNAGMPESLPPEVDAMIGVPLYPETATFPVERAYTYNTLAATQNANPLLWDDAVAAELVGGPIAAPTTLSLWMRPHFWEPGAVGEQVALKVHFDLKRIFDLPEAVMTDNTIVFHEPVRPGDVISNQQVLQSVSGPKTTKLGTGRFWVIDVEFLNQDGVLVGVEQYTGFGYRRANA
jgi:acyl dehydratase